MCNCYQELKTVPIDEYVQHQSANGVRSAFEGLYEC
jgi:hypothetical protein